MASEHTLQLKAVLDTSDVKKKLDELKKQTASAGKGGDGSSVGTNTNLTSVLRNINTTLQNLQRSIDKLYGYGQSVSRQQHALPALAATTLGPTSKSANAIQPASIQNAARTINTVNVALRDLSKSMRELQRFGGPAADSGILGMSKLFSRFEKGKLTGRALYSALKPYDDEGYAWAEHITSKYGSAKSFQSSINKARFNRIANNPLLLREGRERLLAQEAGGQKLKLSSLKSGAAFALQPLFQGGQDYFAAKQQLDLARGNEESAANYGTASTAMGYGSSIAGGAATGAVIGSIIPVIGTGVGAAIGAAVGALKQYLSNLADSVKETAEALEQQSKRIQMSKSVDEAAFQFLQAREDKEALKKKDIAYFTEQQKSYKKMSEDVEKQMKSGPIGFDKGDKNQVAYFLTRYEEGTRDIIDREGKDSKTAKQRQKIADEYRENLEKLQKYTTREEQMKSMVEQLNKEKLSEDQKKFAISQQFVLTDEQKRKINKANKIATLDEEIEQLQERLHEMKAPGMDNVNSLAAQGFMISQSDDEARLEMQTDYLRDIASITREIKNIELTKERVAIYD